MLEGKHHGVACAILAYAQLYDDRNDYKSSYRWQRLAKAATLHGGLRGWHIACKALAQRGDQLYPALQEHRVMEKG